ncbi:MAG: hypothetical protein KGH56_01155 [Patescibacteria group bacterium]|nr:hypothetical protein [Patescibacteria group bacterium]
MENETKNLQMRGAGTHATEAYKLCTTTERAGLRNEAAGIFSSFNND